MFYEYVKFGIPPQPINLSAFDISKLYHIQLYKKNVLNFLPIIYNNYWVLEIW